MPRCCAILLLRIQCAGMGSSPRTSTGLLLGGRHWARGMREYLESNDLQRITAEFFADEKPVAAICHGVLLAAAAKRADGRSRAAWPKKPRRCLGRWNAQPAPLLISGVSGIATIIAPIRKPRGNP